MPWSFGIICLILGVILGLSLSALIRHCPSPMGWWHRRQEAKAEEAMEHLLTRLRRWNKPFARETDLSDGETQAFVDRYDERGRSR